MRVHELAKELNITSKELIEKANEALGLSLKSHSSTISDSSIDKIKALYVDGVQRSVSNVYTTNVFEFDDVSTNHTIEVIFE